MPAGGHLLLPKNAFVKTGFWAASRWRADSGRLLPRGLVAIHRKTRPLKTCRIELPAHSNPGLPSEFRTSRLAGQYEQPPTEALFLCRDGETLPARRGLPERY